MQKQSIASPILSVYRFYADGFTHMTLGKQLWGIILIKLFVMFAIVKIFFFPDYLQEKFATNEQRADFVLTQISTMAKLAAGSVNTADNKACEFSQPETSSITESEELPGN